MSRRCLIVANQTLGAEALRASVNDCIERGVDVFYIVVPRTPVRDETIGWTGGFDISDDVWSPERARAALEALQERSDHFKAEVQEAQARCQRRLELMIEEIHELGGQAEGEVGTADPLEAAKAVLQQQSAFDEVIVSTLPSGLSRWLKMDLPNRLARRTHVPVTSVQAEHAED